MLIVHVFVHVKPESVEAFRAATLENARNSVQEPGVVRFDVAQQEDDPNRFLLMEIYRTAEDPRSRTPRMGLPGSARGRGWSPSASHATTRRQRRPSRRGPTHRR